jgi:hypothetical protein
VTRDLPSPEKALLERALIQRTEVLVSVRKPQPGKIGTKLWAIFDRAGDNSVSQRRNENGDVLTFPTRQHVRAYLKGQMTSEPAE